MKRYRDIKLFDEDSQDLDEYMNEILEKRKLEKATIEAMHDDFPAEETEGDSEGEPEIEDDNEE